MGPKTGFSLFPSPLKSNYNNGRMEAIRRKKKTISWHPRQSPPLHPYTERSTNFLAIGQSPPGKNKLGTQKPAFFPASTIKQVRSNDAPASHVPSTCRRLLRGVLGRKVSHFLRRPKTAPVPAATQNKVFHTSTYTPSIPFRPSDLNWPKPPPPPRPLPWLRLLWCPPSPYANTSIHKQKEHSLHLFSLPSFSTDNEKLKPFLSLSFPPSLSERRRRAHEWETEGRGECIFLWERKGR